MPVTMAKRIENLKHARKLVKQAVMGIGIPQLENTLREADMNLHWALWNLGEIDQLRPELEFHPDGYPAVPCRDVNPPGDVSR